MSTVPLVALALAGALAGPPPPPAAARWSWPVGGGARPAVVAAFDAPAQRWGAGHRGIDLAARRGDRVTAVTDGVVSHRGRIAGRGTVSVTHADGVRSTYEPVDSALRVGQRVRRGQGLGRLGVEPGHCVPAACLHLGARRGDDYLDPMTFFGARRVVLLPLDAR
ncbi:MAG: M23 family peptidase [Kytococcus sp.]|nr:M23 family peptidase [Kytococcus sp.]